MGEELALRPPKPSVKMVICHYCGYTPPELRPPKNGRCPKCYGFSWETIEIPIRLFAFCFQIQ